MVCDKIVEVFSVRYEEAFFKKSSVWVVPIYVPAVQDVSYGYYFEPGVKEAVTQNAVLRFRYFKSKSFGDVFVCEDIDHEQKYGNKTIIVPKI